MGFIIQKSDFVGKYELAKSITDKIDLYIDMYEIQFLNDLLGVELASLLLADLDSYEPQTQRFTDIFEEINFTHCGVNYHSKGIKNILLGFVWFEYVRDSIVAQSQNGAVNTTTETATPVSGNFSYERYNNSISWSETIQKYITLDLDVYPEFNGSIKKATSWI
jgi:hypothetical protein